MRLSTVILPLERWPLSAEKWRRAEELGFDAAYTYDHLTWGPLKHRAWFGAIPTLVAAALSTSRIQLGTMVTSPNFRHPVALAKELLSLDDVSNGRLIIGVGSGGVGEDATVLGEAPWSSHERADRFNEFVSLLDTLLRNDETSFSEAFYGARDARMLPGMIQQPRPSLFVAADGPRGMDVAARYGDGWITLGLSKSKDATCSEVVKSQLSRLDEVLLRYERDSSELNKVLLNGLSDERPLSSLEHSSTGRDAIRRSGLLN